MDTRNLVSQLWRHRDDVDRAGLVPSAPPTYLGQVYSGGSIPTAAGRVYLTRPLSVAVNDVEGSTPAFTPDTSLSVPVLVLRGVATAGQNLLAECVDGRWVAEVLAAACSGTVTVNVKCGGANVASAGVTISLSGTTIASGTTNGSGNFATSLLAAAGTYDLTVAKAGFATYTGTFTFSCANATVNVVLPSTSNVISGVVGGCGNIVGALVTATQGVTTLGTATTNGSGAYSITLSGWSSGAVTVTATKTRYSNGSTVTTPLSCGGTTTANIVLTPATDYYCDPCGGAVPIYKTLYLTQPWDGAIVALTNPSGAGWSGTGTWTGTVYDDCGPTNSSQTVTVYWSFNNSCSVSLRWKGCATLFIPARTPVKDAFAASFPGSVSDDFALGGTVSSHTNSPFSASATMSSYMGGGSGTATITE